MSIDNQDLSDIPEAVNLALNYLQEVLTKHHHLLKEELAHFTDADWQEMGVSSIATISALDGYLTAVLSAPNIIKPSIWMPAIWGSERCVPEWESAEAFEQYSSALFMFYNFVASNLYNGDLVPMIYDAKHTFPHSSFLMWAIGYIQGFALWDIPKADTANIVESLAIIAYQANNNNTFDTIEDIETEADELFDAVLSLHDYFASKRLKSVTRHQPSKGSKRGITKSPKPPKRKRR